MDLNSGHHVAQQQLLPAKLSSILNSSINHLSVCLSIDLSCSQTNLAKTPYDLVSHLIVFIAHNITQQLLTNFSFRILFTDSGDQKFIEF